MAIRLQIDQACYKKDKLGKRKVHYMPCKINFNGPVNFSKYVHIEEDGDELTASFHGHPIMGKEMKVPEKYVGLVLEKSKNFDSSEQEKKVYATHGFDSFVYWNWDKVPNRNDVFIKALDWIDIAEVLHAPISDDVSNL